MGLPGTAFEADTPLAWQLLDRLYAAAAAEIGWDEALDDVRRAGGFDAASLVALDRRGRRQEVIADAGLDAAARPPNPLLNEAVLRSKPGAVWFDRDVMLPGLWDRTAFRREWMAPRGLVTWGCVVVASEPERLVYLEVYAGAARAPLGADATMLLNRLAPHLIRACRVASLAYPTPPRDATREATAGEEAAKVSPLPVSAHLRGTLGLTRAEARLALHLATGRSLARASIDFGVRITTLRSQLGAIYVKTGTGRQCELVAMLLQDPTVATAAKAPELRACA